MILVSTLLFSACESIQYYGQAVSGQLYILTHRQTLTKLLSDPAVSPHLQKQLERISAIRTFAASQLQLPLESHYSTYVELGQPFVVWNVSAVPEFSLQPLTWCYPIAGCVSYRGYFNEAAAQEKASAMAIKGYDVYVGGVAAYSTLGWFSDPILSSIINRQEYELASLIFHELAHQVVYIAGETQFNESFATTVEREGVRRWLQNTRDNRTDTESLTTAVAESIRRQQQFVELVQKAAAYLQYMYNSTLSLPEKRSAKNQRQQQMRSDYARLKVSWQGYNGYDKWFGGELNNAQLATVTTYNNLVPAFASMLDMASGDLPLFYKNVAALAQLNPAQRQEQLQELLLSDATKAQ